MADGLDPLDPSPYITLSVPKDATLATIRSAHRKLVLGCHPDKIQDETAKKAKSEQFHLVQQAYEILSDANRRQRWDERKKLAELRAEVDQERPPFRRRPTEYEPARSSQPPIFEMRGSTMYEERAPKSKMASPKFYDEDTFQSRPPDSRSSRKYDNHYAEMPSPRKTSGRSFDERHVSREAEKLREKKIREQEAFAREESKRKRDRDRRRDTQDKTRDKMAYAEDFTSESEANEPYYSSRSEGRSKRKGDDRKSRRESPPIRSSKNATHDIDEELYDKISHTKEYMKRSSESVDYDDRRPGLGRRRGESYRDRERIPPPPSPPPVPVDTGRRSSGDDGRRSSARNHSSRNPSPIRKTSKDKRKSDNEIVEPSSSYRKASLQHSASEARSPKGAFSSSKSRGEPHRAQTFEQAPRYDHFDHPAPLKRSETMPINDKMHRGPLPFRASNLKNMVSESSSDSSDTDSDATPIIEPPPKTKSRPSPPRHQSTKYKVRLDDDSARTPRTVSVEPEDYFDRSREHSPKIRSSERPPLLSRGASARVAPLRTPSYAPSPIDERTPPRQKLSRAETERMPSFSTKSPRQPFFGEISEESPKSYHSSPKTYDDRHMRSSRRGSEDITERDAYPGSHHRSHGRPNYSRGTVY